MLMPKIWLTIDISMYMYIYTHIILYVTPTRVLYDLIYYSYSELEMQIQDRRSPYDLSG